MSLVYVDKTATIDALKKADIDRVIRDIRPEKQRMRFVICPKSF